MAYSGGSISDCYMNDALFPKSDLPNDSLVGLRLVARASLLQHAAAGSLGRRNSKGSLD